MRLEVSGIHTQRRIKIVLLAIFVVLLFLFSVNLLSTTLSMLGKDTVYKLLNITINPFIGLFIGLLSTAILQSSSATTSMIVAMVASGSLTLSNAVPIVMGANIGTTMTSNLVSLSFIARRGQFRKALTTATSHDFFNIFTAFIVFPLEYYYNILSDASEYLGRLLSFDNNSATYGQLKVIFLEKIPLSQWIISVIGNNYIVALMAVILILVSIKWLSRIIYNELIGNSRNWFERYIFKNAYKSFLWGAAVTVSVQSSSVTTSLVVPVVANGQIKFKNAFPFIIGANIGTTITALIASLFRSEAAISIAIAHLLFNLIGVIIFLPYKPLRKIPMQMAIRLGKLTKKHRIAGFIYLILCFFLIPFLFIFFSS
ncbi:MAG: Na/Pi symporter [Cyclobacteriaceae bacterium]